MPMYLTLHVRPGTLLKSPNKSCVKISTLTIALKSNKNYRRILEFVITFLSIQATVLILMC